MVHRMGWPNTLVEVIRFYGSGRVKKTIPRAYNKLSEDHRMRATRWYVRTLRGAGRASYSLASYRLVTARVAIDIQREPGPGESPAGANDPTAIIGDINKMTKPVRNTREASNVRTVT